MKPQRDSHQRQTATLLRVATILLCLAVLNGCSATQLAYRNLDWLISRKVNQLVDLNGEQQAWFDNQLDVALQWHCQQEIPRYREALTIAGNHLLSPQLDAALLEADARRAQEAADRLLARSAPLMSGLLRRLDHQQVQELSQNMARELDEKYAELVYPPAEERRAESVDKVSNQLETWLGGLNASQSAAIERWAANRDGNNKIWLDNRRAWQGLLIQELPTRQQSDFSQRIYQLLVDYRALQTPAYREQEPRSKQALIQLMVQVMRASTAEQRAHFVSRLNALQEDLQALDCSQGK